MRKNVDMCNLFARKSAKYGAKFATTPYFDVNTPEIAMMSYTYRKSCAGGVCCGDNECAANKDPHKDPRKNSQKDSRKEQAFVIVCLCFSF